MLIPVGQESLLSALMNAYYPDTGGAFLLCKNSYLERVDAFLRGGSYRAGQGILCKREGEEVVR
jgi:hypothetical protein